MKAGSGYSSYGHGRERSWSKFGIFYKLFLTGTFITALLIPFPSFLDDEQNSSTPSSSKRERKMEAESASETNDDAEGKKKKKKKANKQMKPSDDVDDQLNEADESTKKKHVSFRDKKVTFS
jgi:hypothetical protein